MVDCGVSVRFGPIGKALRDHPGMAWILFKPAPSTASPGDVQTLQRVAEELAETWVPPGDYEWIVGVSETPKGLVLTLDHSFELERVEEFLNELAIRLESEGLAGTLSDCPTRRPRAKSPNAISAFIAYTLDGPVFRMPRELNPQPPRPWQVDQEFTDEFTEFAIDWVDGPDTDLMAYLGITWLQLDRENALRSARKFLALTGRTVVAGERATPERTAWATLAYGGCVVMGSVDPALDWRGSVAADTELLLYAPTRTDIGFLRYAGTPVPFWTSIPNNALGFPAGLDESDWRTTRDIWSSYTPDAHGVQMLTDQHLGRAGDLSQWDVREVAPRRFLVQARDLEPWYSTVIPDLDVLEQARKDFGDMILTPEIAVANKSW